MGAYVQQVGSHTATATTMVITVGTAATGFSGTTTVGNRVVVGACTGSGLTISSVVDSRGNAWTIDRQGTAASGATSCIASAVIAPGKVLVTGDTITLTPSSSASVHAGAIEISGVGAADQSATAHITGTTQTLATAVNSAPGDFIVGVQASGGALSTITISSTDADSGGTWTDLAYPYAASTSGGVDIATQPGSASASLYSMAGTASTALNMDACIVSYAGLAPAARGLPILWYAPGWHPGQGLPGLPAGTPFYRPPSALPAAPFTIVQAAPTVQAASLTTATVTLPQPTGTGNTLVACITTNGSTTNPLVSGLTLGGSSDNWQFAFKDPGGVEFGGAIWYDPNCAAGQTSVVVNASGGVGTQPEIYIAVYEVLGVLAVDQGSRGDSASPVTTWSSGTTATTTQASEIFFGVCTATSAVPAVTGVGTWNTQNSGAGTYNQISGYQTVSSTGTATFSGTIPSGEYSAIVATFSAGGGTANVTGVAAAVTVAAGLGTPEGDANVTGVAAQVPVASPAGTPEGDANVTGVAAQVTVASPAGTPSGAANAVGVAAPVTVAGPAGTPSGAVAITGVAAAITVASPAGTPAGSAAVAGVAAQVTAAAPAGTAAGSASVTGVAAPVLVTAGIGAFSASAAIQGTAALVAVMAAAGLPVGGGPPFQVAVGNLRLRWDASTPGSRWEAAGEHARWAATTGAGRWRTSADDDNRWEAGQ